MVDSEPNAQVDVATTLVDMPVDVADSTATADAPPKKVSTSNLADMAMENPRAESNKNKFILFGSVGVLLLLIAAIVAGALSQKCNCHLQLNKTAESTDALPISGEMVMEGPNSYENEGLTTTKEWNVATTSELSTSVEVSKSMEIHLTTGGKTGGTSPTKSAEDWANGLSDLLTTSPVSIITKSPARLSPVTTEKPIELTTEVVKEETSNNNTTVPPEKEDVVPPVPYKTIFMWNGNWSDWSAFEPGHEAFIEPDCPITVGTLYSF